MKRERRVQRRSNRWPWYWLFYLLLIACAPHVEPGDAQVVGEAVRIAWLQAGLERPSSWLRAERFEIVVPGTLVSFKRTCQLPCDREANACYVRRLETGRVRSLRRPAAIVSPVFVEQQAERVLAVAAHELLHGYSEDVLGHVGYNHADKRVWESGGPASVETRAERILYGEPAWPPEAVPGGARRIGDE